MKKQVTGMRALMQSALVMSAVYGIFQSCLAATPVDVTAAGDSMTPTSWNIALVEGTPAINAGDPNAPAQDQGSLDPDGPHDVGAFELQVESDRTVPVTTATLNPAAPNGDNDWYTSGVEVTLNATDAGSGVASTFYRVKIDSRATAFEPYTEPIFISADGACTVTFYSTDTKGNVEEHKTFSFNLDSRAPNTNSLLEGTQGSNGWYAGDVKVTLSADDGGSAVASTTYSVDGGAEQSYTGPITVTDDGSHTVTFFSKDNAGNTSAPKKVSFKIDRTNPVVTAQAKPAVLYSPNNKMVPVTITGTITDATSPIVEAYYQVTDSEALVEPNGPVDVQANGSYQFTVNLLARKAKAAKTNRVYTVKVTAVDAAGNTSSTITTVTVSQDHSPVRL